MAGCTGETNRVPQDQALAENRCLTTLEGRKNSPFFTEPPIQAAARGQWLLPALPLSSRRNKPAVCPRPPVLRQHQALAFWLGDWITKFPCGI